MTQLLILLCLAALFFYSPSCFCYIREYILDDYAKNLLAFKPVSDFKMNVRLKELKGNYGITRVRGKKEQQRTGS